MTLYSSHNMVCSALFLRRALYTVHWANIMQSRNPSFMITHAVLIKTVNHYSFNIRGNIIHCILPKQFHLISFDIDNGWWECIVRIDSGIMSYFLNYFTFHVIVGRWHEMCFVFSAIYLCHRLLVRNDRFNLYVSN